MEDKYTQLSAPELAGEDAFIKWVTDGTDHQRWTDWQQANPGKTTLVSEAKYIVRLMSGAPQEPGIDIKEKNDLWKKINADITSKTRKRNLQRQNRIIRWSLAAAAAIALLFWYNTTTGIQNIIVNPGVTADITLPESSVITVNAGSSVRYNEKHFESERKIRLEGEAFFNVTHGSKFTVVTPQGSVTVVGTSFNVNARPGHFEVNCYTGKVIVEQSPNDKVEITGGQRAYASRPKEHLTTQPFDSSTKEPDWIKGKFTFENQPLSLVAAELERQYDVTVTLSPGLDTLKYNGLFEAGDLEKAVKLIIWPLHLTSNISGKTVTISR